MQPLDERLMVIIIARRRCAPRVSAEISVSGFSEGISAALTKSHLCRAAHT